MAGLTEFNARRGGEMCRLLLGEWRDMVWSGMVYLFFIDSTM